MDTPASTPPPAPKVTPSGSLVQVVKTGDSLFGKAFKVIKEDVEYVICEIKTEFGKIEKVFHKDHLSPIANADPTSVAASEVTASGVALETAPAPAQAASTLPPVENASSQAPEANAS